MESLDQRVTCAQLSDALDSLDQREQVLAGEFVALTRESRALGRAATLEFSPVDDADDEPYEAAIAFIDASTFVAFESL